MIAARDGDERLDQGELLSTMLQLIIAGHDTTASLIGNSVVALLRHPDQLAALRADPDRIPAAIEEFLRYDAPVPHSTFRYASEPIELGGVTIPAGAQVIISLAAANRDHDRYASAEALDIERPDVHHLAFGHGIHFCLGAALARMEGQTRARARSSCAFRICASPFPSKICTGTTATGSSCADSPSSRCFRDRRRATVS